MFLSGGRFHFELEHLVSMPETPSTAPSQTLREGLCRDAKTLPDFEAPAGDANRATPKADRTRCFENHSSDAVTAQSGGDRQAYRSSPDNNDWVLWPAATHFRRSNERVRRKIVVRVRYAEQVVVPLRASYQVQHFPARRGLRSEPIEAE
jgi:hypothetical protein